MKTRLMVMVVLLGMIAGCNSDPIPLVVSLDVLPANQTVAVFESVEYSAVGTYDDDSTADLTFDVTWKSYDGAALDATVDTVFPNANSSFAWPTQAGNFLIEATYPQTDPVTGNTADVIGVTNLTVQ